MIEKCPILNKEQLPKVFSLLENPEIKKFVDEINEQYLYWSDVKYNKGTTAVSAMNYGIV